MADTLGVLTLALVWALFMGELTLFNLSVGALLGLFLLSIVQREEESSLGRRMLAVLRFIYSFFVELFIASIAIAKLALIPKPQFHPHVVAVPLHLQSDGAIALLSATITLLPGTVAMGISEDRSTLYAHAIGERDIDKVHESIIRIERLILGFMR